MTTIDVDGEDGGLVTLVATIADVLLEVMEREAIRRMESETLTDEEIERLGQRLATLEDELEQFKRDQGIEDDVDRLRGDLNGLIESALELPDDAAGLERRAQ
ncbi:MULTISPECIES: gas vesicle protein K [unclassified Haladaptatus]|uniref:gas vesicle protein K n=1 Tax=unclassified Haladaptatus TaxID=2622732 RepID=UPI0023E8D513|nr:MULTISPECIES: gas vesicle protein K [unclassified Haladaptatus]